MAFGTYSAWQYSKWIINVARNSHITNPAGSELAAVKVFLKHLWNPVAQTGSRPWLQTYFQSCAGNASYQGNIDTETPANLVRMLNYAGRDLKKIPITDAEAGYADTLIAATGTRRLGTAPLYGSSSGSILS